VGIKSHDGKERKGKRDKTKENSKEKKHGNRSLEKQRKNYKTSKIEKFNICIELLY
jgi:hypothetical protein